MRPGPIAGAERGHRSPGDPLYDPFWARIDEAGDHRRVSTPATAGYGRYAAEWGESSRDRGVPPQPVQDRSRRPTRRHDTIAALVCHGVFARFPNVRVATIESGCEWVPALVQAAEEVVPQMRGRVRATTRSTTLRDHVWVSPYYEDDLCGCTS